MAIFSRVSNLQIRTKIGLIIAVSVCGFLLLASLYLVARLMETDAVEQNAKAFSEYNAVGRLNDYVLRARVVERAFFQDPGGTPTAEFETNISRAEAAMTELEAISGEIEKLEVMRTGLSEYASRFRASVDISQQLGYGQAEGLLGQMNEAATRMEQRLTSLDQPYLGQLFFIIRRLEAQIQLERNPDILGDISKQFQDFRDVLSTARMGQGSKRQIEALLGSYEQNLQAAIETLLDLARRGDQCSDAFEVLLPALDELAQLGASDFAASQATLERVRKLRGIWSLVFFIVIILAIGVLSLYIGRDMSASIHALSNCMQVLSRGDLDVAVLGQDRKDEIGQMARATQTFKDAAVEMASMRDEEKARHEAEHAREAEDLRQERAQKEALGKEIHNFETGIETVMNALAQASHDMKQAALAVHENVGESAKEGDAATASAEEAASSTRLIAGSADQLAQSISEITNKVRHSGEISEQATQDAREAETRVNALAASSEQIGEVVGMIHKIAERTNLLALNATIESARAGDAGRGFAVVATEVKTLAVQTAEATEDITRQIDQLKGATAQVVQIIQKIVAVIGDMHGIAQSILTGVADQDHATSEISARIGEVAQSTDDTALHVEKMAGGLGQNKATADQLTQVAADLENRSSELRRHIGDFLKVAQ